MMFLETSALEGHNIEEAFSLMIAGTACPSIEIVRRQKLSGGGAAGEGGAAGGTAGDEAGGGGGEGEAVLQLMSYCNLSSSRISHITSRSCVPSPPSCP
jgi:hypothetical protein